MVDQGISLVLCEMFLLLIFKSVITVVLSKRFVYCGESLQNFGCRAMCLPIDVRTYLWFVRVLPLLSYVWPHALDICFASNK